MTDFVITALAAWRLAFMLAEEDGPLAVFARLRYAIGLRQAVVRRDGAPEVAMTAQSPLAELFACVWCMSIWTAALLAWRPLRSLRSILAISGGAIIIQEAIQWLVYRQK